jgi:hypothetical protein
MYRSDFAAVELVFQLLLERSDGFQKGHALEKTLGRRAASIFVVRKLPGPTAGCSPVVSSRVLSRHVGTRQANVL